MRQLPKILLLASTIAIVVIALMISGLRLAMPYLNHWREPLLKQVSSATGLPVSASTLQGRWANFGPVLDIAALRVDLHDGGALRVDRVSLALDVWQSLLHLRWQFRDLTFYQLRLETNAPLRLDGNTKITLKPGQLSDLFLRQFDHFDLRDSEIGFLTPSGQRASLAIPQLTWLNERTRHRAEGLVSLSTLTGQHGAVTVRLDLSDSNGYLDTGRLWMQADDVDVRPWLGQWMRDNTSLESARFSLAAWMSLKEGEISTGDVLLKKGGAHWRGDNQASHSLAVNHVTAHLTRVNDGWRVHLPQTNLTTDGQRWPNGQFSLLWLPDTQADGELRLRATHLDLQRIAPLVVLFGRMAPKLLDNWHILQPRGSIDMLALDIPLKKADQSRFQATWRDLGWQPWSLLPAMAHLNGELSGSVADGVLRFTLNGATLPYPAMFREPLDIRHASGIMHWQYGDDRFVLRGQQFDLDARSLRTTGEFNWAQNRGQAPRLDILAGVNVTDAGDAWRYFPEPLMGKTLVNYLSGAIKGGQVHNASLVFAGNPQLFPFKHNEGMFQVSVPVSNATYQFQPGWPALENLNVNLDFINDGLWMKAEKLKLGNVAGKNISAVIPDYLKKKLIIDGDIAGEGREIGHYFNQTPLKPSLGAALEELQVAGKVGGHLHLNVPLNGEEVHATGDVNFQNNTLFIKPLSSTLHQLSGRFTYDNGNLQSGKMAATWFGQPVDVLFHTRQEKKNFNIGVALQGNWRPGDITPIPAALREKLDGNARWQSDVQIALPYTGGARYEAALTGDLNNVSARLPAPFTKTANQPMPVSINIKGDLHAFNLSGALAGDHRFNSRWRLNKPLRIERGVWENNSHRIPSLPATSGMVLNLPPLNGDAWLTLLGAGVGASTSHSRPLRLPDNVMLHTPLLTLAGQQWHDLTVALAHSMSGSTQISARGREIRGVLAINDRLPWAAHLDYLYYNPQWPDSEATTSSSEQHQPINFSAWPALDFTCDECWLRGQKFGRMAASVAHDRDTLTLRRGLIDSGSTRLTVEGEWVNRVNAQRTALKGKLSGKKINDATNWFGVNSPLHDAPFHIEYDLHWQSAPWQPSEQTLSGVLKTRFGAGQIADVNTGRTGQLLRLVSFDALLRKLRFDFSDTFNQGFYFDSISGTAWIEKGVMRTDNLMVDGLEADIALKGKMDLVKRQINMEAVVAPEISASVGVATAFAVNPVIGAAVFAASKVLAPLWNKISVLRYHLSGPVDKPQIDEVLRKPCDNRGK